MKLYELSENYRLLNDLLEEDADNETLVDTLESINEEITLKAKNIAVVLSNFDSNINILDNEIKRLQERKKREQAKQEFLKEYLKQNMERIGKTKIVTPTHTISIRKNPHKLIVEDESVIPATYTVIIPQSYKIDTTSLKNALKAGEEIPGARLEQGTSLSIK